MMLIVLGTGDNTETVGEMRNVHSDQKDRWVRHMSPVTLLVTGFGSGGISLGTSKQSFDAGPELVTADQ